MWFDWANHPSWTDVVQAAGALIALPLTAISVLKLIQRDTDREEEVASLKEMATAQGKTLALMREELDLNIKRNKAAIRPFFRPYSTRELIAIKMNFVIINVGKACLFRSALEPRPNRVLSSIVTDVKPMAVILTDERILFECLYMAIPSIHETRPNFEVLIEYEDMEGNVYRQTFKRYHNGRRYITETTRPFDVSELLD